MRPIKISFLFLTLWLLLITPTFSQQQEGSILWISTITPTNPQSSLNLATGITIFNNNIYISGIIDTTFLQLNSVIAGYNSEGNQLFSKSVTDTLLSDIVSSNNIFSNRLFVSGTTLSGFFQQIPYLYFANINPTNGNIGQSYTYNTTSYGSKMYYLAPNNIYVGIDILGQDTNIGYLVLNELAQLQSSYTYQKNNTTEYLFDIKATTEAVYLVGNTYLSGAHSDLLLLKLPLDQTPPTEIAFDYNWLDDFGHSLYITKNQELYVGGYVTISTEPLSLAAIIIKYDKDLKPSWQLLFNLASDTTGYNILPFVSLCDITVDEDSGNIYFVYNELFKNSPPKAHLCKIDKNKNVLLNKEYNNAIFTSIALDSSKYIYTAGGLTTTNIMCVATWKLQKYTPIGYVEGEVTTTDNFPIEGAIVEAYEGSNLVEATTTDQNGRYNLVLSTGTYTLKASSTGFISSFSNEFNVLEGSTKTINFVLERLSFGFLEGYVFDAQSSQPLSKAIVEVYSNQTLVSSATTDSNGYYLFTLDEGNYDIKVYIPLLYQVEISTNIIIYPGQTTTKNFYLKPLPKGILRGLVLSEDEAIPIADANIEVYYELSLISSTTTNESGIYSISLPTGTYVVKTSAYGYSSKTSTATIVENSTTTLNFLLKKLPMATLKGTVLSSYNAEPVVQAKLDFYQNQTHIKTIYTDNSGNYEVVLLTGTYYLEISALGYETKTDTVTLNEGDVITKNFILQKILMGILSGNVTTEQNIPISGAIVEVLNDAQIVISSITTSDNGNYILYLPVGVYNVRVSSTGYITYYSSGVVINSDQTTTLNIKLLTLKKGYISGLILEHNTTEPLNGVNVIFKKSNIFVSSTTTDNSGKYHFELEVGTYTVSVSYPGYLTETKTAFIAENSTTTVNFLLKKLYYIKGKILTSNGQPLSGVILTLTSDSTSYQTVSDINGNYEFKDLLSNNYILTPQKENWYFTPMSYQYSPLSSNKENQNFTAYQQQQQQPSTKVSLPIGEVEVPAKDKIKVVFSNKYLTSQDNIYIVFNSLPFEKYKLKIINLLGEIVYETEKVATKEYEFFEWEPKEISSGSYLIIVEGKNLKAIKKISLVK